MTVTNSEEMLVEWLAHVWCQNEIILILFVGIMHTKAFPGWISKPCDHIRFNYFGTSRPFIFLYFERILCWVWDPIIVIQPLLVKVYHHWDLTYRLLVLSSWVSCIVTWWTGVLSYIVGTLIRTVRSSKVTRSGFTLILRWLTRSSLLRFL